MTFPSTLLYSVNGPALEPAIGGNMSVYDPDTPGRDVDQMRRELELPAQVGPWLHALKPHAADHSLRLPDDAEAEHLLARLGADTAATRATLSARPTSHNHAALWWLLDRLYNDTMAHMGKGVPIEGFAGWPAIPQSAGVVGRHLYVWLYLALLPQVRRVHRERGIPDSLSWANLGLLGEVMRVHQRLTGANGLGGIPHWSPPLRFRGADFQLGRLEFNRVAIALANGACGWALNVHIPAGKPLAAEACDTAFTAAREFFPRHFPDEPIAFFVCSSWLLDPQLVDYLPSTSNIVQFQRRFRLVPTPAHHHSPHDDHVLLEYLFGRLHTQPTIPAELLDQLPQQTTLRRAYVMHLRAGRHWRSRTGWFPC